MGKIAEIAEECVAPPSSRRRDMLGYIFAILFGSLLCAFATRGFAWAILGFSPFILFGILVFSGTQLTREEGRTHTGMDFLRRVFLISSFCVLGFSIGVGYCFLKARATCHACDPLYLALEHYHQQHGQYPATLDELPIVQTISSQHGIQIRQGEFLDNGIDLNEINHADIVLFLDKEYYTSLVPVTKKLPMSFTRLYTFIRTSDSAAWKFDSIVWTYCPRSM